MLVPPRFLLTSSLVLCLLAAAACSSPTPPVSPEVKDRGEPTPAVSPQPTAPAEPAEPAQPKPAEPAPTEPPAMPADLSPECRKLLEDLRSIQKEIPTVFIDMKRSGDEINTDMIRVAELARRFLKECPGSTAECEIKATLARVLLGRSARYREEVQKSGVPAAEVETRMSEYLDEIGRLAEAAEASCPAASPSRHTAMRALMELSLKRHNYEKVRELGTRILDEKPTYDVRTGVFADVVQTYLLESRYDDAIKYLRGVIEKHSGDIEYVVYNIRLFDSLMGAGELEQMEELLHLIRAEYPARYGTLPQGTYRGQYEQWYQCQALFWLGFIRMALGDMVGAENYFSQNVNEIESLEAKLSQEGQKIDNVCKIICEFRTKHLLEFIRTKYGKQPEVNLDSVLWVGPGRVSLKESTGKVVAMVFRRPGDQRAATFLQEIDRLAKAREKDGLVGVTLSFLAGRASPEEDLKVIQAMEEDLQKLGVTLPAGYDTDRERQNLVRELYGTVGTASFTVINRRGEFAWFLADPRDLDRKLAVRVLERLLEEK